MPAWSSVPGLAVEPAGIFPKLIHSFVSASIIVQPFGLVSMRWPPKSFM